MGVIAWSPLQGGWLSGLYRKDAEITGPQSAARRREANDYDLSLPENQRKLDAAEQLAQLAEEAGLTLIQLALAFVLNHPAVTAPIIGPRTMEHLESQLAAADVVLEQAVLDRIDEIVPPGVNLNRRRWLAESVPAAGGEAPVAGYEHDNKGGDGRLSAVPDADGTRSDDDAWRGWRQDRTAGGWWLALTGLRAPT